MKDKEYIREHIYSGSKPMSCKATQDHHIFAEAIASKEVKCVTSTSQQGERHINLPLVKTSPAYRQTKDQVVRIIYDPPMPGRNVMTSIDLAARYRQLIFYVDLLHNRILAPKDQPKKISQKEEFSLNEELFEWIRQQILGRKESQSSEGKPKMYPMVGLIDDRDWALINTPGSVYTTTQKMLAKYLASGQIDAKETACDLFETYLAEHTGERIEISFMIIQLKQSGEIKTDYLRDIL
jgi:hypothetical protein